MKNKTALCVLLLTGFTSIAAHAQMKEWPSYNRTVGSDRYATLPDIDTKNVGKLKVICSFDTGEQSFFQSGLIETDGALYGTTEHDTFSLDPNTCKLNWRIHEDFATSAPKSNRGVAYLDHRVFRGTNDGKVVAYDARTGKRLWATPIADPKLGESVSAAAIAWNGLVFIGNAGGENKGVKGRMYALDAKDGHVVWEFYLAPKAAGDASRGPAAKGSAGAKEGGGGAATWTSYSIDAQTGLLYIPTGAPSPDSVQGAKRADVPYANSIVVLDAKSGEYKKHFPLVKRDFHGWDVSSAPTLFLNRMAKPMLAEAPKDGYLHLIALTDGRTVFKKPVTTISNVEAPLTKQGTHFCPGTLGGAAWNGASFDPVLNVIFTGETHWCTTMKSSGDKGPVSEAEKFGQQDDPKSWAGLVTASDVGSGARKWQFRAGAPVVGGVTPTSGGLVLFGDIGGTFYALNGTTGEKILAKDLGGPIGGGVITYDMNMGQRIAVAVGMVSPAWPTAKVNAKVVVLGI
jgi:glucose dehydrogenase